LLPQLCSIDRRADLPKNTRPMSNPLSHKRLAVLGAGKMGGILLRAFLDQKLVSPTHVAATVRHAERAEKLGKALGVRIATDNRAAVKGADVVLLAVKPTQVAEVLQEIRGELKPGAVVVSVAASVPTKFIEQHLGGDAPVVRAMPNTPCAIGCGMTGISRGSHAGAMHLELARAMFEAVGRVVVLDEKHMDAVTGLSASGVAFVYILLESLAEGGLASRRGHFASGADHAGRGAHRTRDRRSSGVVEGRRNHAGGLHHRRHHGTGRREGSRDADQGGGEGHGARPGIDVRRGVRVCGGWLRIAACVRMCGLSNA